MIGRVIAHRIGEIEAQPFADHMELFLRKYYFTSHHLTS